MRKLIALALAMAALGAAGAMVALRLLSRPRVAPAPYGPAAPLPTPGDFDSPSDSPPDDPRLADPGPAWVAEVEATPTHAPADVIEAGMVTESGVLLPEEVLAEERDDGIPAPLASVAEPLGDLGANRPATADPESPGEDTLSTVGAAPDATDEVPSHHLPPAVSDVLGEPAAMAADVVDVEPSHVLPATVSEVTGEHTEAVFEAEESLATPVTETIAHVAGTNAEAGGDADRDFLTSYFNQLADSPVDEAMAPEGSLDTAIADDSPKNAEVDRPLAGPIEDAPAARPAEDIGSLGRRDAESYLDEGNVYFNVGQYGLAIERYGKAIELDSELTAAYYNRANARTRAGEYDGALSDYDRALVLQPRDADALNNRGMLHLYRASYDDALKDFHAALAIDPTDTTVMVNRGLAQLHGGDAAAALVDFQSAASLDSTDAAAHYGAAQAAAALENRSESLRHLSRAFEIDPGYAREAAADPKLQTLQGDDEFMRLLRESGSRAER